MYRFLKKHLFNNRTSIAIFKGCVRNFLFASIGLFLKMRKSFVRKSTSSLPSASSVRLLWNICSSRTEALVVLSQLLQTVSGASEVSQDGRWCPLPESAVTAGIVWLLQVPSWMSSWCMLWSTEPCMPATCQSRYHILF